MSDKHDQAGDLNLHLRLMRVERDLVALDARHRKDDRDVKDTLQLISQEISSFGARVAEDVQQVNQKIDDIITGKYRRVKKNKKNGKNGS